MDANARTGVRTEENPAVLGAYGRDTRTHDSNGTSLLQFADNNKLALVNTFFSTPKNGTSRTFNGTGRRTTDKKRIDYIITRQKHRKLVRKVVVHPQPRHLPDSDHNIVSATVRFLGRFARNRPRRVPTGHSRIDRRAVTSDTNRREQLFQHIRSELQQSTLDATVSTLSTNFAHILLSTSWAGQENPLAVGARCSAQFEELDAEILTRAFNDENEESHRRHRKKIKCWKVRAILAFLKNWKMA